MAPGDNEEISVVARLKNCNGTFLFERSSPWLPFAGDAHMSGKHFSEQETAKVLTVAGSDSGGGAGIQADLKTFTALGVFGGSVVTALTAQNTIGVQGIHTPNPEFISLQLESVLSDMSFKVVKTGMLPSVEIVEVCAAAFRKYEITNLIVDPVMVATSGDALAGGREWVRCVKQHLLPLALIVTPNLTEASRFVGRPIRSERDIRVACSEIFRMGCKKRPHQGWSHTRKESFRLGGEFGLRCRRNRHSIRWQKLPCVLEAAA